MKVDRSHAQFSTGAPTDYDDAEREAAEALRLFQIHQGRDEELARQAQQQWLRALEKVNRQAA